MIMPSRYCTELRMLYVIIMRCENGKLRGACSAVMARGHVEQMFVKAVRVGDLSVVPLPRHRFRSVFGVRPGCFRYGRRKARESTDCTGPAPNGVSLRIDILCKGVSPKLALRASVTHSHPCVLATTPNTDERPGRRSVSTRLVICHCRPPGHRRRSIYAFWSCTCLINSIQVRAPCVLAVLHFDSEFCALHCVTFVPSDDCMSSDKRPS